MIAIPIWLFVILVTLSSILTLIVGIYIIAYVKYCHYKDEKTREQVEKNYGNKN